MRFFYTFLFSAIFFSVVAQTSSPRYKFRVYLKDKGAGSYTVSEPEKFLSKEAMERKKRQKVKIDESDFPISPDYFALAEKAGGKVVSHSKWFNTLVVEVNDSLSVEAIRHLPFVDSVQYVWRGTDPPRRTMLRPRLEKTDCDEDTVSDTIFGRTEGQFKMHHAEAMANAGFRGKGIRVGVIDAGFTNVDAIPYFDRLKLRGFENFVPWGDIFAANDHGTKVLSTMAVNQPGRMMGSAPEALYWLLRSEDVRSEFPVEEDYWVRAIEYADSIGLDLINTSLGYNFFDDRWLSYTHSDLTGAVSLMSRAADKAFDKGMLVVVSAGNEGNKIWQKTTPPGDAKNVLTVGAVGTDSLIAAFSSRGLTADGRIKPDVVSVGRSTVTIGQNGAIGHTNGTSLSSPFLAGLVASLWSVNPDVHRSEIIDIVKRSSDRFLSPDSVYGNGIPDFQKAMKEVLKTLKMHTGHVSENGWDIRRSPNGGYTVKCIDPAFTDEAYTLTVLDENGHILSENTFDEHYTSFVLVSKDVKNKNLFLHFVLNEPFAQRVYRMKL